MPTFIAHVEFRMKADSFEDGGRRLRELATAASAVGFELERGQVDLLPLTRPMTLADGPATSDELNDRRRAQASFPNTGPGASPSS